MWKTLRHLVLAAEPRGDADAVHRLVKAATEGGVDAIAMVGDLTGPNPTAETLASLFKILGSANLPTYHVPGPDDAPIVDYLREAYNVELVYPFMHSVHGTFSIGPGHVVFAGMGGEIIDEATRTREEVTRLRYEAWEVEYRLKVLQELKDSLKVFLFTTPPAHRGLGEAGSQELAQLVKTYNPQLVVVRTPELRTETLGASLVVSPGFLIQGSAALFDFRERRVERFSLS
ncbi:MAG: heat-stable protein [Armatimonadota bacterium]|nr:heat-stable protein [Armatimonadota bacterium]MDR7443013.1 heat-stable protein [Armatimonadota bacterium]MDR7569383.1 heat-stable protein [Armatimonadota bacterium]MDR7614532.1 heat-stable protein [Armatimonadota bacterium]